MFYMNRVHRRRQNHSFKIAYRTYLKMKKLRVSHVITGLGAGGAEQMLQRVVVGASKRDNTQQSVISLMDDGHFGGQIREAGVPLRCIGIRAKARSYRHFRLLVDELKAAQPDIIMTWLYHADLLGLIASRLVGSVPVIWNLRCSNIDFTQYGYGTRAVSVALKRLSRYPVAVACNSHAGKIAHEAIGYRPRRWLELPNGYDTARWKPDPTDRAEVRQMLGIDDTTCLIMSVARNDPQKDHGTLFQALTRLYGHQKYKLILVGSGTENIKIPSALMGRVTALGARYDVDRLLRGADIAVSSSAYGEGFPNSVAEAMATGLLCIGTDVGDTRIIIGEAGRVVKARDAAGLECALKEALQMNHVERSKIGILARNQIRNKYSIDTCLDAYEKAWESAVKTENSET